jgi:hypothetical protein
MEEVINNNTEQVNQQPQPETPTPPKQNNNIFKLLFFIAIFVLIAVVVIAIVLIKKPNKETTINDNSIQTIEETGSMAVKEDNKTKDWKTYENKEYGFSIKYPKEFLIKESSTKMGSLIAYIYRSEYENTIGTYPRISINLESGLNLDIESWYKKVHSSSISAGATYINTKIMGINSIKVEDPLGESTQVVYYIPYQNKVYSLSHDIGVSGDLLKIIDTFKFIETDETSSWETYKNEDWGLSFKYPPTYTITKNTVFEPSHLVHGEEGKGDLILEDKTREGTPVLKLMFNPDGMGGACGVGSNDYFYKTEITNNNLVIFEKNQNTNPPVDGCPDNLTPDILFNIGSYSNIGLDYSNFKNGIHTRFFYSKGDYQPELDKIIETIEITKPKIYGQRSY